MRPDGIILTLSDQDDFGGGASNHTQYQVQNRKGKNTPSVQRLPQSRNRFTGAGEYRGRTLKYKLTTFCLCGKGCTCLVNQE